MGLKGKSIIIRADDMGYSLVNNMGSFKTIEEGMTTAADVMLDCPGTEDALSRLRNFPWISVGWHTHFWGSPVLGAARVPSLVDETGRFRRDLPGLNDVNYDEALAELNAEIEMCVDILGKSPDTGLGSYPGSETPFARAMDKVCERFLIERNFYRRADGKGGATEFPAGLANPRAMPFREYIDPKWEGRNIYMAGLGTARFVIQDSIKTFVEYYDPISMYLNDECGLADLPEGSVLAHGFHPGYVDDFMYFRGDYGKMALNFIMCRIVDIEGLCSDRLRNWIRENEIRLINFTDALYGTDVYQRHLRDIGSDLCMLK